MAKAASSDPNGYDITAAWERAKKRLDRMTKEETLQTFVTAGILTKKGRPTKPYREMEDSTKPCVLLITAANPLEISSASVFRSR